MKKDLLKIVETLDWENPNIELEPEQFEATIDTLNLTGEFENQVKTEQGGYIAVETEHGKAKFPFEMTLDILKRMNKPAFKRKSLDKIIRDDKRHLKYVKWFQIIKSPDFEFDPEAAIARADLLDKIEKELEGEWDWQTIQGAYHKHGLSEYEGLQVRWESEQRIEHTNLASYDIRPFVQMYLENKRG